MTIYVISDLHLGHANILTFKRGDGVPLRPFPNLATMHQFMAHQWDSVVDPKDKVYVLGDVSMSKSHEVQGWLMDRPGHKRLVMGNHDLNGVRWYLDAGFEEVYGVRQINGVWLTHVPMHDCSMYRAIGNIHGHLHHNVVTWDTGEPASKGCPALPDLRYFNASVERINYTPKSITAIVEERAWHASK